MNNILKLFIAVAIPLLVGAVSGFFTTAEIPGWYQTINKPSWNPPSWIFAPVWTTLYILMGVALYLIWKAEADPLTKKAAIALFAIQLVFNFFWSFIFFNRHLIGWALADIVLMWLFILLTIFTFAGINKSAAWLLVPYISWVSFASILNYTIWKLN